MLDMVRLYVSVLLFTYVILEVTYILVDFSKDKDKDDVKYLLKIMLGIGLVPFVNIYAFLFDCVLLFGVIIHTLFCNKSNLFFNPLKIKNNNNKNKLDK